MLDNGTITGTLAPVASPSDELVGERVRLTPLKLENIYTHFEWNNDPELNRLDSELPFEEESFGVFKQRFEQMACHPSPHHRDFEIALEDGTLIGVASLADISTDHRHATVGVTIAEETGWEEYGREVLELLLDFAFETLGMHRVEADCFVYHARWKALVEEAGFLPEGRARDYLYRDGVFWDKASYALLEGEYRAREAA